MSDPTPGDLPAWLFEMPNPIEDAPAMDDGASGAYRPGSSPKAHPIWSDWSLHPPNADGKGGVKT
jgi:hypothetical protein